MSPFHLSLLLAVAGLGCFLWPAIQRMRGLPLRQAAEEGGGWRSPLWWAGLILTALAVYIQRGA